MAMVCVGLGTACAGAGASQTTPATAYEPVMDPSAFVAEVNNPLFPLIPGTTLTYQSGDETVEFSVLAERKISQGVSTVTVHDVASVNGEVIEDTYDWFAQDRSGAVWYFGEDTKELSGGAVVSTNGSWEAGVDGAKPGIIIPSAPAVGMVYRQEYFAGVAEDMGEILETDASATVPYGSYTGCLKTRDFTPLDTNLDENKYYCPGVGVVLVIDVVTGQREELVSIEVR
jgi:hypothetical protein